MKHRVSQTSKALMVLLALCIILTGSAFAVTLPETGQNDCYGYQASGNTWAPISCTGTGEDGEILAGASWPSPRFINNGDGTITDTLINPSPADNLQWMANANCLKMYYPSLDTFTGTMPDTAGDGGVNWDTALNFVKGINSGTYPNCQFGHTDWRLPNRNELSSLVNFDKYNPFVQYGNLILYLEANGFTNIRQDVVQGWAPYWTSTTRLSPLTTTPTKTDAYIVDFFEGLITWQGKNTATAVPLGSPTYWSAVLPVRSLVSCTPTNGGVEICDGIDNDCDGQIDEGLGSTQTTCGVGACERTGTLSCVGGAMVDSCTPGQPSAEVCDNIDNNCNGVTDEGLIRGSNCGVGVCVSTGTETCVAGNWTNNTCTPGTPSVEVCDGVDNDCNGQIDDNIASTPTTCGVGSCARTGTLSCVGGTMVDNCTPGQPSAEVCDGADNDCDGQVDEGVLNNYYQDADADGFGNPSVLLFQSCGIICTTPGCPTTNNTDCNDSNASVNPGATEINNNGIDDDCNPATPVPSVSGSGNNYPVPLFRASLSLNVNASSLGTGSLSYYYTRNRIYLVATSIAGITSSGGTATITGTGTMNGTPNYTFTATITDGSPDSTGIVIYSPGGALYFSTGGTKPVSSGNYTVVGQ